ncbi:MAG: addiction module toxin RelE [Chitinivibrionia bacterium]|nr:addiction module toxin RelE [Chitinivibrionia bacterium]
MAYSVVYKKSVHRDLKSLSRAEAKRIMDLIEHELIKRPESNLIASEILILRIGDRKNVYKREI